jgi:hypothetical protein
MTHPYVVLGGNTQKDEEREAFSKMTERQRRTYLRELEKEKTSGKKKNGENDSDSFSEGDISDDDGLGPMMTMPAPKYDPDMLVKERAAREGKTLSRAPEDRAQPPSSDDDEEADEDDLSGSAESFEEDSDELDRLDKEAEKLVGRKDPLVPKDQEDAGSDDEEDVEEDD